MGFEFCAVIKRNNELAVRELKNELRKLTNSGEADGTVRYFAYELSYFLIQPGNKLEENVWGGDEHVLTFRDLTSSWCRDRDLDLPDEDDLVLWWQEVPWMWKMPAKTKARLAGLFEKYGFLDLWLDMIRESCWCDTVISRFLSGLYNGFVKIKPFHTEG